MTRAFAAPTGLLQYANKNRKPSAEARNRADSRAVRAPTLLLHITSSVAVVLDVQLQHRTSRTPTCECNIQNVISPLQYLSRNKNELLSLDKVFDERDKPRRLLRQNPRFASPFDATRSLPTLSGGDTRTAAVGLCGPQFAHKLAKTGNLRRTRTPQGGLKSRSLVAACGNL